MGLKHDDTLIGAIKRCANSSTHCGNFFRLEGTEYVITSKLENKVLLFTKEAEDFLSKGSSEVRTFNAIPNEGISKEKIEVT